jgi:hypothetical protein
MLLPELTPQPKWRLSTGGTPMFHFLIALLFLGAAGSAYQEGFISVEVLAIGMFFSVYLICMGYLYRN